MIGVIIKAAQHYFRKLQQTGKSPNDHYLTSWGLTQVYYQYGDADSIAKYALQTLAQSDTLYNIGAAENLQKAQAQYNYTRHLETAHRKELEAKESQVRLYRWIAGSITAAVIFAILILLLRKQVRKKGEELTVANKENAQLYTQIKENSKLIFGLNEQLRKKDADIKTLVLLKDSTEQLARQLEMEIRKRDSVKAKGKAEDTRIVKLFAQMAESRTEMPVAENWAELFSVMDNHFPSFTLHIKSCHSIGKNEYQVCVLTKLGFRVSDIAYLTNNSSNSITNLRSRMMTKLFGEEGGAKDFDAKIASL